MSKYLSEELRSFKDQLTVKFYQDLPFQLTLDDQQAVTQAYEMISINRKYKSCHYACCALYQSGVYKCGTHLHCRRMPEFSVCAEHRPIERSHFRERRNQPDPIITLATFHAGHDSTGQYVRDPYLASPCEKCLRLLRQVVPDCLVVVDLDGNGRLAKVPLEAVEFFRHPQNHIGD